MEKLFTQHLFVFLEWQVMRSREIKISGIKRNLLFANKHYKEIKNFLQSLSMISFFGNRGMSKPCFVVSVIR